MIDTPPPSQISPATFWDPDPVQLRLLQGEDSPALPAYQDTETSFGVQLQKFLQRSQALLQREIFQLEGESAERLKRLNEKRKKQGLSPLDFRQITQKIQAIDEQPGLDPKEKKKKIEALRKELKLSKGDMKALFTKRLQKIHQLAAKRLENYEKARRRQLEMQIEQAKKLFGEKSVEVKALERREKMLGELLTPQREEYAKRAGFYGSLYPSFWSKFKSFFNKIGSGLKKGLGAVFKFVPGLKTLATVTKGLIRPWFDLFRGKFGAFAKNLAKGIGNTFSKVPKLASLLPGIGTLATWVQAGIETFEEAFSKK